MQFVILEPTNFEPITVIVPRWSCGPVGDELPRDGDHSAGGQLHQCRKWVERDLRADPWHRDIDIRGGGSSKIRPHALGSHLLLGLEFGSANSGGDFIGRSTTHMQARHFSLAYKLVFDFLLCRQVGRGMMSCFPPEQVAGPIQQLALVLVRVRSGAKHTMVKMRSGIPWVHMPCAAFPISLSTITELMSLLSRKGGEAGG